MAPVGEPHLRDDGSLYIRARLTIPADEVHLRVTTSGGHPFQLTAGMTRLSFSCVSDNGTYVVVGA